MKSLKIFPKILATTFFILSMLVIGIHVSIYFIFPKTYLETKQQELSIKADQISSNLNLKEESQIMDFVNLYSKGNDITLMAGAETVSNEFEISQGIPADFSSYTNSLVIEERQIQTKTGDNLNLQFITTTDLQKEAISLSWKFLPYTLFLSFVMSLMIAWIYARIITKQVQQMKKTMRKMKELDRHALLEVQTTDEIGELKTQINQLYINLLQVIDDVEEKNETILQLEKIKYEFFRGRSHDLKTPLASLKIILENMKYHVGKYKNRDYYIDECIQIVDGLTEKVVTLLRESKEALGEKAKWISLEEEIQKVTQDHHWIAMKRNLTIHSHIVSKQLLIGQEAFKIVLSNIFSNAYQYAKKGSIIRIVSDENCLIIQNEVNDEIEEMNDLLEENQKKTGIGLLVVQNLLEHYGFKYRLKQSEKQVTVTIVFPKIIE
ncbi:HAMP domain-containing sensor histidine kinase [uncultured Granulicatella sp.]|jgi:sensor histidine kinase vncS|uniref:HAMP domain-containing sensor histidine kinase n=1 Tax=uncultured Granulicatella sp. TaxID=316089 RepID=UPI0028EFF594|nr:HAMP domain-containing sensor histidine kinase [uncultured Granulicatella sp.]